MAQHSFAKHAVKGVQQAYEYSVFALNIPMKDSERERLKKLYREACEILNKY